MGPSSTTGISDKDRLLFGAGFVFGVLCTLLILMVVVATVTQESAQSLVTRDVFATIIAGVCFLLIVGIAMYGLAFPENRLKIPTGESFGLQPEPSASDEGPDRNEEGPTGESQVDEDTPEKQ